MAAHQFYGPKGAGALFVRQGLRIVPLIYGGIQETGRRPALKMSLPLSAWARPRSWLKRTAGQDDLFTAVERPHNRYHGRGKKCLSDSDRENRLAGHVSFCVEFIEGESMLLLLAAKGIFSASGSACSSKALKASPVLLSMGVPAGLAQGSIVFSLGSGTLLRMWIICFRSSCGHQEITGDFPVCAGLGR